MPTTLAPSSAYRTIFHIALFERGGSLLYAISSALGATCFTVLIAALTMGRVLLGILSSCSASGICLALISSPRRSRSRRRWWSMWTVHQHGCHQPSHG